MKRTQVQVMREHIAILKRIGYSQVVIEIAEKVLAEHEEKEQKATRVDGTR